MTQALSLFSSTLLGGPGSPFELFHEYPDGLILMCLHLKDSLTMKPKYPEMFLRRYRQHLCMFWSRNANLFTPLCKMLVRKKNDTNIKPFIQWKDKLLWAKQNLVLHLQILLTVPEVAAGYHEVLSIRSVLCICLWGVCTACVLFQESAVPRRFKYFRFPILAHSLPGFKSQ